MNGPFQNRDDGNAFDRLGDLWTVGPRGVNANHNVSVFVEARPRADNPFLGDQCGMVAILNVHDFPDCRRAWPLLDRGPGGGLFGNRLLARFRLTARRWALASRGT